MASLKRHLRRGLGIYLGVQWLRLSLPEQGIWVLIPGWGAKIQHTAWPKKKKKTKHKTQKQYCNKLNKDLKKWSHQKKKGLKNKEQDMVEGRGPRQRSTEVKKAGKF